MKVLPQSEMNTMNQHLTKPCFFYSHTCLGKQHVLNYMATFGVYFYYKKLLSFFGPGLINSPAYANT